MTEIVRHEGAEPHRVVGDPHEGVTRVQPTYLTEPAGTLAFFHAPDGVATDVGTAVLLCPPFGWEEACCYRSLRGTATLLARAGYPTARLTLPGTADGAGGPRDGDLLRQWIDAVGAGATWLRRRTGARRCVAFGIGMGGMLAYLAAGKQAPIDDLVLWGVPDRGRTLLVQSKALSRVIASEFPEDQHEDVAGEGGLQLFGYLMSPETEAALSGVQLSALPLPYGEQHRVLLLSAGALPVDQRLQNGIEAAGAEVTVLRTTDYHALMANPQLSKTPKATVAQVVEWLARPPEGAARGASRPLRSTERVQEALELAVDGTVVETPFSAPGRHGELFGILSRDNSASPAPLALLMLGAGALPHTGPNRAWVELGRRWAARGVPAVRLDQAGIGEAGGEDPELLSDDSIHEPWRIDDVRTVLDQLQAEGVAERFVLGGLCSGAHCSLRTALADSRVRGLLLINLFAVRWSGELVDERRRRAAIAAGLPDARTHRLDRELVAKVRHVRPDRAWRLWRRSAERRQLADAITAFDQLRELDTETLLLFGREEPLYEQFARQGLLDQLDRWPNVRLERIPSREHMFRAPWLQRHVHERLDEALVQMLARFPQEAASPSR